MSQRSQVAKCICLCLCLCHCLFVGWVTCPHHSDRLLQRSQVSRIALWRLIISNSSYGLYLWLAGWNSLHCFPLSLFIAAREKGIFQSFPKSERSQSRTRSKFWSASPADETLSRLLWSNKPSLYEEQKMLSGRHPAGGGKVGKSYLLVKLDFNQTVTSLVFVQRYWIDVTFNLKVSNHSSQSIGKFGIC